MSGSVDDFIKATNEQIKKIEEFQSRPDTISPYIIIRGVADVLLASVPLVSDVKWIAKGFELLGTFLKKYSENK
jgi:hypothetical protein